MTDKKIQPIPKPLGKSEFLDNLKRFTVQTGDLFFHEGLGRSYFCRVDRIGKNKYHDEVVFLSYTQDGVNWSSKNPTGGKNWEEIGDLKRYFKKILIDPGETIQQIISRLNEKLIDALLHPENYNNDDEEDDSEVENSGTDIVLQGGKERYEEAAWALEKAKIEASIIAQMAKERANMISHQVYALEKKIRRVRRVLMILEVYLGVNEEIVQIAEGVPASVDTPISIRQMVLCMDEEAAIAKIYNTRDGFFVKGDINWRNVETFDEWLLSDEEHLNQVLPEKKGIVALRASRQKRYDDRDALERAQNEQQDAMIYLLARNGDNIYRCWANVMMPEMLFPTREEGEKIADLFSEAEFSFEKEHAEDAHAIWLRNALLLQGLIDRTAIFYPLPVKRIVLADPATYEENGYVNLIRDCEMLITDGHISFEEWRDKLTKKIVRGTRIYFMGVEYDRDGHANRFNRYLVNSLTVPEPGVYTVDEVGEKRFYGTSYLIRYLPNDPVYEKNWDYWGKEHPRKNRIGFYTFRNEIFNYDEIDVEMIDYFLKSRLERSNYRTLMPLLISLREMRLEELRVEADFVKLMSEKYDITEKKLWKLVDWWKKKVINHRPLTQDDSKAWRMILSKAKRS